MPHPSHRPASGVYGLFAAQAARSPEDPALIAGDERLTYAELRARAEQLSGRLANLGVGPETIVGICLPRSVAMMVSVLAVLRAGGAYLPLDPGYPTERLAFMLDDAEVKVLLGAGGVARALADRRGELLLLDPRREPDAPESATDRPPMVHEDSVAYVSYTSGSTGWPKGVAMRHGALHNLILWQNEDSRVGRGARTLQFASLSFDVSFQELFATWSTGGCLALISEDEQRDPAALLSRIASFGVERLYLPFVALRQLARAAVERGVTPAALREIITAGEQLRITPEIQAWLDRLPDAELQNQYGPAETHVVTAHRLVVPASCWPTLPPIGRPVANTDIHLLDGHFQPVAAGAEGELYIGGEGLCRGYWRRPARTAAAFLPHPWSSEPGARLYRSGDLARYNAGGEIEFLGRVDHQLKVRGVRVEPGEVESVLGQEPGVREAVAVAREDALGEKRLIAYVVFEGPEDEAPVARWRASLERQLPHFMWPSAYVLLDSLPLTPSGKIDRLSLPAPGRSGLGVRERPYAEPRTPLEAELAAIFGEALELDRVGVHDDFFSLGGHSLLASRVASRTWRDLGVELPLRAIFEHPTVAGLSEVVEELTSQGTGAATAAIEPVARGGDLALSFGQERMWFLHRMQPSSTAYNLPMRLRLKGSLDAGALGRALSEIVRRHEVLRTVYGSTGGRPAQVILPAAGQPLLRIDLELLEPEARRREARRLGETEARQPFALEAEPPLRTTLLRLGRGEHLLLLTFHHIASDGWSDRIFFRELSTLYDAFSAGSVSPLPPLRLQVVDFAAWLRGWMTGPVLETRLAYWREQLGAHREPLELPTDRPRPALASGSGARRRLAIRGDLRRALEDFGRRRGATLFMVLLAGFQALLHRLTGQGAISVGTPIANRERPESQDLIGFFVNTLALRTELADDPRAPRLVSRVREVTLGAYAHQELPFEKLVEELEPRREPGRAPLFQTMFVMQESLADAIRLGGLESRFEMRDNGGAMFDLTLYVGEHDGAGGGEHRGALEAVLEYPTDLFDATTIDRLGHSYARLLEALATAPENRVSELPLLSAPERHLLTVEAADTAVPLPEESLHEIFARRATEIPEAVALIHGEESLTYAELEARSNRLAHHLGASGVGQEAVVAICLERSPAMVEAILAVLKAGGAYMPLESSFPTRRLAMMLRDSGTRVVISRRALIESLLTGSETDPKLVDLDADREAIERSPEAEPAVASSDALAAYVIYTSGSSGAPKGVVGLHRGAVNRCRWMWRTHPFAPGEVACQKTVPTFVDSVWEIFGPLLAGVPSVLVPEPVVADVEALARLLAARRVSRIVLVPSLLRVLLETVDDPDRDLPALRHWVVSGETLPPELARRFAAALPRARLLNLYGSSEVAADVTCEDLTSWASNAPVPVGRPIANTAVHLVDRRLRRLPLGARGELAVGGVGLARGYLDRPALTAEKFVPDPWGELGGRLYLTGDRARVLADGRIELLGRLDAQVKVRGFRIELGEVEATLASHPAVRQAVVVARRGADGDTRLVAYVVAEAGAATELPRALRAFLAGRLPDFMLPSAFTLLGELPLLVNGKVDRAALPEPRTTAEAAFVAPRNPTEEVLAEIWREVLGVERLGVHDNFFRLGGHSLLATRVTSRLRRALGVEVAPRAVFEHPTVARLAACVDHERRHDPRQPPLVSREMGSELPLSFAQERLWFLDQLEPGNPAYNLPEAWELTGELDRAALAGALAEIVRRHAVLRSTFPGIDGRPTLMIAGRARLSLPLIDLSALGARSRALSRYLAREQARLPFDLGRPLLVRAVLLRLRGDRHVLMLTLHHSVADGWSRAVLRQELAALYDAGRRGLSSPLAELPVQYADYAAWQRGWLRGEALRDQLAFWRERLVGLEPLRLPTDRPRPARRSHRGASIPLTVGEGTVAKLRDLGAERGGSLYMTLLAAFFVVLRRLTGERDLAVGTLVGGRGQEELEGLIGLFVNSLVLRVDAGGDPPFPRLLRRVRRAALEAFSHQDLPFEKLVAELAPERDLTRNPLFQVVFAMHETPLTLELAELECRPLEVGESTARFDLAVHLWESGGGLEGFVTYDTDLFDATTVARLAASLELLMRAVGEEQASRGRRASGTSRQRRAGGIERRVSELPVTTRAERHQVSIEWNDRRRGPEECPDLLDLILARAASVPGAVAVAGDGVALTYGELARRSGTLASTLSARGVGPESLVGLHLERSPELVVAILAVWRAGGAFVPLDPGLPAARLDAMIAEAGVSLVLTHGGAPLAAERVLDVDQLPPGGAPPATARRSPDGLAYVIFTSGSTGRPKGVAVPHRGVANRLLWGQETYPLVAADAVLQLASPGFDFSVWEILAPLMTGARVVLAGAEEGPDLEGLAALIRRQRVTVAHFVPSLLEAWLETEGAGECVSLRRVFSGGEALAADLCRRFHDLLDAELDNQYGPTEASIDVTYQPTRGRPVGASVPIGHPIADTEIHLLDARLRPVPLGAPGEITIAGAGLARGYLGRPAATAERFVPHPGCTEPGSRLYRSGDQGRFRPDGAIELLGRLDHQVQIRGVRVELGEIEQVLREQPSVKAAAVVIDDRDRRLVAYVVPSGPARLAELRGALEKRLPVVMIPAVFVPLGILPRTSQGKIDRRALARVTPTSAPEASGADHVPPRGPVEEIVAEIWSRVLGVERIGARDNFFALGGHSLLATQVVSRIRRALGVELTVRALFEHRTVADLGAHLLAAGDRSAAPALAVVRQEAPPLSFAQERLWFLDRLEGPSAVYNMHTALRLGGELITAAAARALREIVRRHQTLRTTFPSADGQARQRIAPPPRTVLKVVDLRHLPPDERRVEARRLAREEAERPFDLGRGPLFRAILLELAAERHLLLLSMHHIVSDGWSTGVFRSEFVSLYRAFARGLPSPLPELQVQYADFAVWQRRWLTGNVLDAQLAYWREQLAELGELRLPVDRPRPAVQTFRGATRELALPEDVTRSLERLSLEAGASLYMTLLAGFSALLVRVTGQRRVAVGSPIANRGVEEIEGLIGFFVNTLVLRADLLRGDLTHGESFADLLGRIRETALEAYAHQDLPFEKLVEEMAPERDLSRHPLFQVLFTLQNAPRPALELPGLTLSEIEVESRVVRFDQEWHLWQEDGVLRGSVVYATDLFDAATVDRLARGLTHLLREAAARPDRPFDDLPLLPAAERHQLLAEWGPSADDDGSAGAGFLERFARQVARAPEAVAVVHAEDQTSYAELDRRSRRLAGQLRDLGVGPEVTVALVLDRSPAMAVAVLAVLRAGGVYVPLDPAYPGERLGWMLADARARVVLADRYGARRLPAHDFPPITLDSSGFAEDLPPPSASSWPRARCENLAYLIYTSGSTGRPKGVAMRRGALDRLITWQLREPRFAGGLKTLQLASLSFDVSFQEMFSTWSSGGTLLLVDEGLRRDARALLRRIAAARVERLFLPFVALEQLAEVAALAGGPPASLREILTAGEQLRITDPIRRLAASVSLTNQYGPSESHVVTAWPLEGAARSWPTLPAIGRPIEGSRVHLLDAELCPVPIGSAGHLFIGGASLARGYWRRPAAAAERFVPDPFGGAGERLYASGDLARYLGDGSIELLGRLDHQVKIRGFRVEPGEVEAVLESRPEIRRAAVLALGGSTGQTSGGGGWSGERLVACVVTTSGADAEAPRGWLRQRLPEHLVPSEIVAVDALPSTPSGKLDRRALERRIVELLRGWSGADQVAPRDDLELALARIFAEVLGRDRVGVRDDFFRLGGHSLSSVRLMARIEHRFGVPLPLATVFSHRTVEALCALLRPDVLRADHVSPRPSALVAIEPRGDRPALFFVHPGGGQVLCYRDLGRHLDAAQPFHGLQAPEIDTPRGFALDVESMAVRYLDAVLEAGFEPPYRFGGWSMGGLVAFEMARQARDRGQEVEFLALIDTAPPLAEPPRIEQAELLAWFARDLGLPAEPAPAGLDQVLERALAAGLPSSAPDVARLRRHYDLFRNNVRAAHRYRGGRFDGRVTLFTAAERPPAEAREMAREMARAWGELAAGSVEQVTVPGDHFSLVREPHVRALAEALGGSLRRLERRALQPI
ncbi:MAG: amino acid adenylation domain-containing protein [bacterium]|nr:amino acid adenylation domain-containing protein [bacterium]